MGNMQVNSTSPHNTLYLRDSDVLQALISVLKEMIFRDSKRIYKPQELGFRRSIFMKQIKAAVIKPQLLYIECRKQEDGKYSIKIDRAAIIQICIIGKWFIDKWIITDPIDRPAIIRICIIGKWCIDR